MLYSPCGLRPLERLAQVQAQLANLQVALSASRHHKSRPNASTGWLLHICMISLYIYITVLVGCGHWSRWHGRRRRCFGHRGWQSSMWHCLQASQVEIEGINCMRKVAIAYMHDQFLDHSPGGLRPLEPLAWALAQMPNLQVALPASRHHKSKSNASTV